MQEEIEHKTVNLAISTTKLSARTLLRGMQFLLRQYDKHASQGKQSMKRLVRQNRGVTNVEIQKTGIKHNRLCIGLLLSEGQTRFYRCRSYLSGTHSQPYPNTNTISSGVLQCKISYAT